MVVAAAVALGSGTAASADGRLVGKALIVNPDNGTPMNSGGSKTFFQLDVSGAAGRCPGDTAHGSYLVYTYFVPTRVDPGSVSYTIVPQGHLGLIASEAYVGALDTIKNTGAVPPLPGNFVFSRWTPTDLFPAGASSAAWEAGVACVNFGRTITYWNVEIVFTASHSDPGGFVWRLAHHESAPGALHRLLVVLLAGVAGAAAVMLVYAAVTHRPRVRRPAAPPRAVEPRDEPVTASGGLLQ
jgi:hypothetical protein